VAARAAQGREDRGSADGLHLAGPGRVILRRGMAVLAALLLASVLAGVAEAQRAPRGASGGATAAGTAPRAARTGVAARPAAGRMFPKLLGEGWFSKVYASRDGAYVMKVMKPRIGDVRAVSPKRRAELARRTVRASEMLRKSGLPVPRSFIPPGRQGVIVQERAGGLTLARLRGAPRQKAKKEAAKVFRAGNRLAKAKKATTWYIDENIDNLRFDRTGKLTAWIDPVVPIKGAEAWGVVDARVAAGL
jgi:hypothetical protein